MNSRDNYIMSEVTHSSKVRVLSYLLPSMLASVLLNIPKFLEAKLETITYLHNNVTHSNLIINVTSMRVDPAYMYYYIHWTRYCTTIYIILSMISFSLPTP